MKKILTIFLFLTTCNLFSQNNSELILDFPIFDYPYIKISANTVNKKNNTNNQFLFYLNSYSNPSFNQSVQLSADFYNTLNFAFSKLNVKIFDKPFLNHLSETIIYTGAIFFATYVPLGDAWLHEEFHRAVLTENQVNSFNEVNKFPFFKELISVNNVKDNELINFKNNNPSDFVRLHAAGIEGEYMLIRNLQSRNFFFEQNLPYFINNLVWTINSAYYVYFCHLNDAEVTTNSVIAKEDDNIPIRDFTGLDFTAWVYDLNRPFELYQERGTHPSGVGLDRYIAPSDLSEQELKYLKKQGFLQGINFLSPMLLGIKKIPFSVKNKNMFFNFAARHILSSFGNKICFDFFLKTQKFNFLTALNFYNNRYLTLPGAEFGFYHKEFKLKNLKIISSAKTILWLQPENLLYNDRNYKAGGLFETKIELGKNNFFPYLLLSAKTKGWAAGYIFQEKSLSINFGFSFYLF